MNVYSYVNNNPQIFIDHIGLKKANDWAEIGAIGGATIGAGIAAGGSVAADVLTGGLNILATPAEIAAGTAGGAAIGYAIGNILGSIADWWDDCPDATLMTAPGNQAHSGISRRVEEIRSSIALSGQKKPDKCDVLQELIDSGEISEFAAKSTKKDWGCTHSRASKDKIRK